MEKPQRRRNVTLSFSLAIANHKTIEGQYEIADRMLDYAEKNHVHTIATIGGYRMEAKDKPKVLSPQPAKT
jgi:proteasome assembly chaperone (PAC2) family protein